MDYKIAIVGEDNAEDEKLLSDSTDQELDRILSDASIRRSECFVSNVFSLRPPRGDVTNLFSNRGDKRTVPGLPPLSLGKYLLSDYLGEVHRLHKEL